MYLKNIVVLVAVVLIIFGVAQARTGSIVKEFAFPAHSLKVNSVNGYDLVTLRGCDLTIQEIGKPIIPFVNLNVLIPPSAEITSIEILDSKQIEISGKYNIYPGQNPYPLSYQDERVFVEPDREIYNLTTPYPGYLTKTILSGNKSGFRIGSFFLYPLQYIPQEGKLILNERIRIKINYEENHYEVWSLTESQKNLFQSDIKNLVINPEDIEKFAPPIKASDPTNIDYVILTSSSLESRFTPLVNWLKKIGYNTETRNVTWVNSNYTGRDLQEKIRNFIRDYFTNYGMKYILLAGDHSIIPSRQARAVVGSYVGNIPCDLYYLDLQWSWDGNNNNIFGEASYDTVDLYYDLYGGRWPVETPAEVDTLIRKFFTYVKNPNIGYQKRMMLPAAFLWSGYDHTTSQNMIAGYSPTGWTDRVIDMGQNDAWRWAVRDSLNSGFGFLHMVGHGNDYGVYISGPMYYYSDPATQTNYDKLTIANSIACYPGNFETNDCLAELMVLARGSAIATIMNSRYGWGYSNQIGPSELLDVRFYDYFFNRDSVRIANCHQSSKEYYRSSAQSQQVWRWCYYELNLFGEPQMMMWKDNPQTMNASFANPIYPGPQSFTVTVTSSGSPVASAIVALWKGTEVFTKGITNSSGQVSLSINPTSTGYMYITVTAKNKLPIEDSVQVITPTQYDVGVIKILQPSGTITQNTVITPACSVYNYGNTTVSFSVRMKIGGFYNQTASVSNLLPGTKQYVTFANWTATQLGTHTVSCSTELTNDANTSNDKQTGSVTVETPPPPAWTQKPNVPTQVARKFVSSGGALIGVGNNLYAFRGNNSNEFYRFDGSNWALMASAPATVGAGGALCYDGSNTIYATQGNGKNAFWAYSISGNSWTTKTNIPVTVKDGTSLAYYGGKVYLLAGGQRVNRPNFYTYNPSTNTWTQLANAPTPDNLAYGAGSCLAELGGKIYALKNDGTINYFHAYSISTNAWTQMPSMPLVHPYLGTNNLVGDGGAMTSSGSEIYAIKGNGYNEFWKYTEGTPGNWTPLDTIPRLNSKSVPKAGASLGYANSKVWLIKGNNTQEFWQYDPSLGSIALTTPQTNISLLADNTEISKFSFNISPNPISRNALIHYTLPVSGKVSIKLYSVTGGLIQTLNDEYQHAGTYTILFTTKHLSKGIYFLKFDNMVNRTNLKIIIN